MTEANGLIVTFYSWKGGAGRTMALANTAVQLARKGRRILMIDWDLEAPGLDRYFDNSEAVAAGVKMQKATDESGLLGLLLDAANSNGKSSGASSWQKRLSKISVPQPPSEYQTPKNSEISSLHFLASGHTKDDYAEKLAGFSWSTFFAEQNGAIWLEDFRSAIMGHYDFVFIDSRTGLTDSGGVCTIQMPDALALMFTANDESLEGGLSVVNSIQKTRSNFVFERAPLTIMPILSRWDGDSEVDLAQAWMKRFDKLLKPVVSSWLPSIFSPVRFLERTRIPHVARFSFGEPLPILTHSLTDANLPGLSYETIARLIDSKFADAGRIVDPQYAEPQFKAGLTSEDDLKLLALCEDPSALHQEIAKISKQFGTDSEELYYFLGAAGSVLIGAGKYLDAEPLLRRGLAIGQSRYSRTDKRLAMNLSILATLLRDTNRRSEAEPLARQALQIAKKNFEPNSEEMAAATNNLADMLRIGRKFKEAEKLYRQSLKIRQSKADENNPKTALVMGNLAALLTQMNRHDDAEKLYREALSAEERIFGKDHVEVAGTLNNLGGLLWKLKRYDELEPLNQRVLAIAEKNFGPDHPKIAIILKNQADIYSQRGDRDKEILLRRRVLDIREKSFGLNGIKTIEAVEDLAQALILTEEFDEATSLLQRAINAHERRDGRDSEQLVADMFSLAATLARSGRKAESRQKLKEAILVAKTELAVDHPMTALIQKTLHENFSRKTAKKRAKTKVR